MPVNSRIGLKLTGSSRLNRRENSHFVDIPRTHLFFENPCSTTPRSFVCTGDQLKRSFRRDHKYECYDNKLQSAGSVACCACVTRPRRPLFVKRIYTGPALAGYWVTIARK
ncbi:hypothetical protein EVAR_8872_1 [Eumeta japonica]|uniref:Uncharacterized protein n=1 Tax=Eumeta variegata TaxID=151549 RepID=A0A4C1U069_EUMVA|nr:hypothetical protein EVAR_8872_1 [Eumeta japonica]